LLFIRAIDERKCAYRLPFLFIFLTKAKIGVNFKIREEGGESLFYKVFKELFYDSN